MNIDQTENIIDKLKKHPAKTALLITVIIIVFIVASWLQGYLGEKGRQAAYSEQDLLHDIKAIDKKESNKFASQFPDGYQLFGILEKKIIPSNKPSSEKLIINWDTAKIINVNSSSITIMLPSAMFPGNNYFGSNTITVPNRVGVISEGYSINNISVVVKILDSDKNKIVALIGFIKK